MKATRVQIAIEAPGGDQPPAGSPVLVQLVDTLMQDEAARVVAEARVLSAAGPLLATVQLDLPDSGDGDLTAYVHVDVDGDGTVSAGDFITMQSYPCERRMVVQVRKVVA